MEREVGGGLGMGNTCKSMGDSFQCVTKPTTIKKNKNKTKQNLSVTYSEPSLVMVPLCPCFLHIRGSASLD